jgi:anthranilate synthase component I
VALSDHYTSIPFKKIISDTKLDFVKLYHLDPNFYSALLETVSNSRSEVTFDILFLDPRQILILDSSEKLQLINNKTEEIKTFESNNFLDNFNKLFKNKEVKNKELKSKKFKNEKCKDKNSYYPFSGGWFIFLAYELANQIEPALNLKNFDPNLPIAYACRHQSALIYDHYKQELVLFSEELENINRLKKKILSDISQIKIINSQQVDKNLGVTHTEIEEDLDENYISAVKKIKKYIVEGDIFQVNLSRKWKKTFNETDHHKLSTHLYQNLRDNNPAPFSALVSLTTQKENISIISSSPERLVKVRDNLVESRPIAGTRPRSDNPEKDQELLKQLHAHPKEQSEHVMLIDLIRNDLGRICIPGSIHVDEFMINETYQYVHHIVSNVIGKLDMNMKPGDVIKATFPGGTITGCPKVRCMEIIDELEKSARGAYTGSLGYINNDGSLDLNILIRTMVLQQRSHEKVSRDRENSNSHEQNLSLRAGAGIVNESNPEKELMETFAKAKGMLMTISQNFKNRE